ncbi:MAG TPA: cytochrome C oxidase subunit IV family protein [Fimbriimonadaceae bacterium]|nr:cytochrome C oxidase subunit IV family protein [Fimbriimonadaceae bacterium]
MASSGHSNGIHIFPKMMYVKTLVALLVLMFLTVAVAQVNLSHIVARWGWDPGVGTVLNNIIAMTIAVVKGLLVIQFFMHVKFGSDLVKLWAMTGFIWVTLMLFILMDYGTRKYEPAPAFDADKGSALYREITRTGENPPPDNYPIVRPR